MMWTHIATKLVRSIKFANTITFVSRGGSMVINAVNHLLSEMTRSECRNNQRSTETDTRLELKTKQARPYPFCPFDPIF